MKLGALVLRGGRIIYSRTPPVGALASRLFHSTILGKSNNNNEPSKDATATAPASTICSARASAAVELLPSYLADARSVERYSPTTPNGALQLSVAENQMLEDLLVPSLTEFSSSIPFPADAIYYQPTHGRPSFRIAMGKYLDDLLGLSTHNLSLDVDGLVVGAGCNAVLENLCICLAAPGESVLIPTPYYAAFEFDLVARAGLNVVPVTTMEYHKDLEPKTDSGSIPEQAYYPTRASLDAAADKASANGNTPRILLLSHPQNPLGICYPPYVIQECIDWCRDRKIHLVSDEIYAGSIYRGTTSANFKSAMEVGATSTDTTTTPGLGLGPYIHLVYALSKDFALSGLRVGVSYSENPEIRTPLQKLNDLCCISSHTQLLVEKMMTTSSTSDPNLSWTNDFLAKNHERLTERGTTLQNCLDELSIPYLNGQAGLFVWMDFREFLPSSSSSSDDTDTDADERERILYLELLMDYGLLFTPGRSMKNELPGFFRCVFSAASEEEFHLGLKRLRHYVHSKRGEEEEGTK